MEYKRVKPDRKLIAKTATPDTTEVVFCGNYEICMIAGIENGSLTGYAIFSHVPGKGRDAYLEFVYTLPQLREQGLATNLLKYCEDYLSEQRVQHIFSKLFLNPVFAEEYDHFLTGRGYIPIGVTGRMLHYRLEEMLDAGTIQTMIKFRKKLPPVKDFKSAGNQRINALLARHNETGFFFVKEEADPRYCRFYMEDDMINAAVIASRPKEDTFFISAIYMDRQAEKKNVFLELFSECIAPVCDEISEKDIKVIVMLDRKAIYDGLMTVFNPPDNEYLVIEHMKDIRKGKTG
ncbi:MAG: GNAT family N-acetyltransferase [Lachnospiraceae bacterium]|nr:GNAT family N-acetyltransferase [Lachnospiraceae bacterium]